MSDLFIHKYELIFGVPIQITEEYFSPIKSAAEKQIKLEDFIRESDANSYKITAHNISFSIEQSTATGSKNSWIEVNNLSDDIVNYVADNVGDRLAIQLKAGYMGSVKQLFIGTIKRFSDTFSEATRTTRFDVEDGGVNLREAISKRSYSKGTQVDTIISDLLDDLGVPKAEGGIVTLGEDIQCRAPFYVTGKTSTSLWQVAHDFGLDFSIINNAAYVVPKNKKTGQFIPSIGIGSGLIGDITPANETEGKAAGESSAKRYTFKSLLNADIVPMGGVDLVHPRYNGTFKVISVTHGGTYEGSDWLSDVVVEELSS